MTQRGKKKKKKKIVSFCSRELNLIYKATRQQGNKESYHQHKVRN